MRASLLIVLFAVSIVPSAYGAEPDPEIAAEPRPETAPPPAAPAATEESSPPEAAAPIGRPGPPRTETSSDVKPPAPPEPAGPYEQGKVRVGLGGGLISSSSTVNFGLSVSVGYFVIDNLEVGADTAFQFGDSPFAALLGPAVRVLFPINRSVHPYVGAFYRHWFLTEGIDDIDTVGARAGIVVRTSSTFFQIGIVYETIVSECEGDCDDFYPEIGVSLIF